MKSRRKSGAPTRLPSTPFSPIPNHGRHPQHLAGSTNYIHSLYMSWSRRRAWRARVNVRGWLLPWRRRRPPCITDATQLNGHFYTGPSTSLCVSMVVLWCVANGVKVEVRDFSIVLMLEMGSVRVFWSVWWLRIAMIWKSWWEKFHVLIFFSWWWQIVFFSRLLCFTYSFKIYWKILVI